MLYVGHALVVLPRCIFLHKEPKPQYPAARAQEVINLGLVVGHAKLCRNRADRQTIRTISGVIQAVCRGAEVGCDGGRQIYGGHLGQDGGPSIIPD